MELNEWVKMSPSEFEEALASAQKPISATRYPRLWHLAMRTAGIWRRNLGEDALEKPYWLDMAAVRNPQDWRWGIADGGLALGIANETLAPAQKHSSSSVAAARSMDSEKASIAAAVLVLLKTRPMTDLELATALGRSENTVRPRRVELRDGGFVIAAGETVNPSGRRATLWKLAREAS